MKIRNILSVLFVGLLFTSCNSEEEVQRGNEDGRDISFSMTLTLGEVTAMTKAGGDIAEGYTYSTEDEVKVNNVVSLYLMRRMELWVSAWSTSL